MKRILVIANNLSQASYRLRVAALIEPLRGRGFELDVHVRPRNLFARRRLLRRAAQYHAVLLQRKLLDPWDARLLRRSARRVIYDVDDAVMFDQKARGRFSQWRLTRRFEATASMLDCAVVGNDYLAGIILPKCGNVIVLPTVVDPAHYPVKEHAAGEVVRLVWIGSHSTMGYLREQLPSLEAAARKLASLRLLIIADTTFTSDVISIEHESWSERTESASLLRGDIGIAPTPLNHWTLGKCGFKIVQYMAAGLPVIASPVGANAHIVQDAETGFLAETPEQWEEAITKLAGDPALRQAMGQAGRRRVESQYSLEREVGTWSHILAM